MMLEESQDCDGEGRVVQKTCPSNSRGNQGNLSLNTVLWSRMIISI